MFSRLSCGVHHLTLNHLHNKQDRDRRGGLLILAYLFHSNSDHWWSSKEINQTYEKGDTCHGKQIFFQLE